jgi:hypothetical protein|eukprot:SAG25_NODE_3472_length_1069_cov_1.315464_2_plen_94_part_00
MHVQTRCATEWECVAAGAVLSLTDITNDVSLWRKGVWEYAEMQGGAVAESGGYYRHNAVPTPHLFPYTLSRAAKLRLRMRCTGGTNGSDNCRD